MSIFKIFTEKASQNTQSTPKQVSTSQLAPYTTRQSIILWKDSEYKKSLEIFEKYFSTLLLVSDNTKLFYNKVYSVGLEGKILVCLNNEENFAKLPKEYITTTIEKARIIANAYLMTNFPEYEYSFIKYYNEFAEILDPYNPITNLGEIDKNIYYLEKLFREPKSPLL